MLEILKLKKQKLISYTKNGKMIGTSDPYAQGSRVFRFIQQTGEQAALIMAMADADKVNNMLILPGSTFDDVIFNVSAVSRIDYTHSELSCESGISIVSLNDQNEVEILGVNINDTLQRNEHALLKRSPYSYKKFLALYDIAQDGVVTLVDPTGSVWMVSAEAVERWYTKEVDKSYGAHMLNTYIKSLLYKRV